MYKNNHWGRQTKSFNNLLTGIEKTYLIFSKFVKIELYNFIHYLKRGLRF